MEVYISETRTEVIRNVGNYIYESGADVIFICSTSKQNAETLDFDIPTYFLNPKEPIEMGIMLKFLANEYSKFIIVRSEYLTIPDVKEIQQHLGDNIVFFGVFDDQDSKKRHLSSYYLDREYNTK